MHMPRERFLWLSVTVALSLLLLRAPAQQPGLEGSRLTGVGVARAAQPVAATKQTRVYHNTLKELTDPAPLLADYPAFIEPV
ncbi:MAG: hypothetical protein ACKOJF_28160, partial [Planctomycetaceae bacterium]